MLNPILYICNKWHLWTRDRSTLMNYLSYSTRPWQNLFLAFHFRSSFCHLFSAQLDESNYLNLSYIIPYYPSYINFQPKSQVCSTTCIAFFLYFFDPNPYCCESVGPSVFIFFSTIAVSAQFIAWSHTMARQWCKWQPRVRF